MEGLNGPYLFDAMYAEDAEGQKLNSMPGVDELMMVYKEKFSGICQQVFELGIAKHEERVQEVRMFWECINEAKQENKDLGMSHISQFMEYKKQVQFSLKSILILS